MFSPEAYRELVSVAVAVGVCLIVPILMWPPHIQIRGNQFRGALMFGVAWVYVCAFVTAFISPKWGFYLFLSLTALAMLGGYMIMGYVCRQLSNEPPRLALVANANVHGDENGENTLDGEVTVLHSRHGMRNSNSFYGGSISGSNHDIGSMGMLSRQPSTTSAPNSARISHSGAEFTALPGALTRNTSGSTPIYNGREISAPRLLSKSAANLAEMSRILSETDPSTLDDTNGTNGFARRNSFDTSFKMVSGCVCLFDVVGVVALFVALFVVPFDRLLACHVCVCVRVVT